MADAGCASNRSLFLVVHMVQHTQEKRSPLIPHGGRHFQEAASSTTSTKDRHRSGLKSEARGITKTVKPEIKNNFNEKALLLQLCNFLSTPKKSKDVQYQFAKIFVNTVFLQMDYNKPMHA